MAFYGKYEDDGPSLAQKIAKELQKGKQDDEVRLTARYCNSGNDDGNGYFREDSDIKPTPAQKSPKVVSSVNSKPFSEAKVGDYIEGLEGLGKVVSISGPNDSEPVKKDPLSPEKIAKIRKWLEKKGFSYESETQGQHSYWLEAKKLSVITDPRFIIVNGEYTVWEEDETFTTVKSAKERIKELLSI